MRRPGARSTRVGSNPDAFNQKASAGPATPIPDIKTVLLVMMQTLPPAASEVSGAKTPGTRILHGPEKQMHVAMTLPARYCVRNPGGDPWFSVTRRAACGLLTMRRERRIELAPGVF